jgi:hypothetical protein
VDLPNVDLPNLPYAVLVPVVIQLARFAIELSRQPRSKPPSRSAISPPRSKETTVVRYLKLCADGSQTWRLPDDVDVPQLKATIREAMQDRRLISVKVVTDGMESDLDVDGSRVTAFTVVGVPTQNVVGL